MQEYHILKLPAMTRILFDSIGNFIKWLIWISIFNQFSGYADLGLDIKIYIHIKVVTSV